MGFHRYFWILSVAARRRGYLTAIKSGQKREVRGLPGGGEKESSERRVEQSRSRGEVEPASSLAKVGGDPFRKSEREILRWARGLPMAAWSRY